MVEFITGGLFDSLLGLVSGSASGSSTNGCPPKPC